MLHDNQLAHVEILIQQKRFAEAENILKGLLAEDGNNADYLMLMAEVKLQQDEREQANSIVDQAIGIAPDEPYLYYIKARINMLDSRYGDAEKHIQQAVELAPQNANYFAIWAHIKLTRKQYKEALRLADQALEIDAENLLGLNVRSTTLLRLNDKEGSFETIEGALREDPHNAFTHANYGWGLLEKGDHKKALEHFQEALRIDPNHEYARAGMAEALKATNPVYRVFLKYSFFMRRLTAKYQWGVIIGFYFAVRFLRSIARANEGLEPYIMPVVIVLALLAFSTWIIEPISNLFLRFNKYGQHLLDKNEKMSSNLVAASFGLFVIGLALYFVLQADAYLAAATYGFTMMIPLSVVFTPTKRKSLLRLYVFGLALSGFFAVAIAFMTGEIFSALTLVYILAFFAFQWVANFLIIREDNP